MHDILAFGGQNGMILMDKHPYHFYTKIFITHSSFFSLKYYERDVLL